MSIWLEAELPQPLCGVNHAGGKIATIQATTVSFCIHHHHHHLYCYPVDEGRRVCQTETANFTKRKTFPKVIIKSETRIQIFNNFQWFARYYYYHDVLKDGTPTIQVPQQPVGWGTWLEVLTIKNTDTDNFTKKGLSIVTICKIRNTDPYIQPKSNNAPLKVLWKESDNITKFIRL